MVMIVRRLSTFIVFLGLVLSSSAFAHSPVKATSPADGAVLMQAPDVVQIVFAKPVRMAKLTISHQDSDEIIATYKGEKAFQTDHHFQLEALSKGGYKVTWRALAKDGHVMKGAFSFKVE